MTAIDVVKFPDSGKSHRHANNRQQQNPGKRVQNAQGDAQTNDMFLNYLRDMVTGPYQRLSEARFEEMLEILTEQDAFARGKFEALESGLEDVVTETNFLRQKYDALQERIEIIVEQAETERLQTRNAFNEAMGQLRSEFEMKAAILAETLQSSLKENARSTQISLSSLSESVKANKEESTRLFEQAQASSLNSLETRIAQWRAEIEDERKEDMSEVAAAMMEIGKRMMAQRKPGM